MRMTNALCCIFALSLTGLLSACGDSSDAATSGTSSTSSTTSTAATPAAAPATTPSATTSTTSKGTTTTPTSSTTSAPVTTIPSAPVATSVAFSTANYTVLQSAGSVTVTASRSASSGAASVSYATSNGTAAAGQNFTAQSGTLSWADGDATVKNIVVPVSSTTIGKAVNFEVTLSKPSGTSVGSPASTTVTITPASASSISVSISGSKLIDAQGNEIQLRGVNVSGLEQTAVLGWSPSNPWGNNTGTPTPDWDTIKTWGTNVVRLPLNEASWLGLSCVDEGGFGSTTTNGVKTQNKPGTTVKADPGNNYQATVANSVAGATAAGLYVILDLHWAAPGNICPTLQNAMADADHSLTFWTSVASTFKSSPNVIFELFNEPFLDMTRRWSVTHRGRICSTEATLTSVAAAAPGNSITVPTPGRARACSRCSMRCVPPAPPMWC
jgi:hypothetical protein